MSEIQDNENQLITEIESLNKRLRELKQSCADEILEQKQKLKHIEFTAEAQKQLDALKTSQSTNERIKKEYLRVKQNLESVIDPTSKINSLESQIKAATEEIEKLKLNLKGFSQFQNEFKVLKLDLKEKKDRAEALQLQCVRMDQDIKNLKANIQKLEKLGPEIQKLEKNLNKFIQEENILNKLKNEVFQ